MKGISAHDHRTLERMCYTSDVSKTQATRHQWAIRLHETSSTHWSPGTKTAPASSTALGSLLTKCKSAGAVEACQQLPQLLE